MFAKVFAISALVAAVQAGVLAPSYATSYSSSHVAAPVLSQGYAASPVLSHGYAAPAVVSHGYAAPVVSHGYAASPVVSHGYAAAPVAHAQDYYAHPQYQFSYGVQDAHTGDHKTQEETRDGDVVKGSYSLLEADGTTRTVHYTADDHNGFNAVVERTGHAGHPQQIQKAVIAAPALYHH